MLKAARKTFVMHLSCVVFLYAVFSSACDRRIESSARSLSNPLVGRTVHGNSDRRADRECPVTSDRSFSEKTGETAASGQDIELVRNGAPASVIVVAAKPLVNGLTPENPLMQDGRINSRVFAEELQYWIERATGAKIPLVDEDNVPDDKTLILFGENELTKKFGFDCRNLPPEGFRIVTFSRGVALLGDVFPAEQRGGYYCNKMDGNYPNPAPGKGDFIDRSIGHATYEFLEKFLGYRFYHGADRKQEDEVLFGTIIPNTERLVIPGATDLTRTPSFQHRWGVMTVSNLSDQLAWYRCFRYGGTADVHANHTHVAWHTAYGDTYPEIFALKKDGTPYFRDQSVKPGMRSAINYAHPKVLELEIAQIEYWDKHKKLPHGWRWYATPNRLVPTPADGKWYDFSKEAVTLSKPDGDLYETQTDVYWKYVEKLALVAKERWPERMVVGSAYNRRMIPPSDKVNLPDNVACQMALCRSSAMTTQKVYWDWMDKTINRWWELLGRDRMRLGTWDYFCWPQSFVPAPVVNPFHTQKFLRHFHSKIAGQFVNPGGKKRLNHLMIIVWHKLLWDKDADVAAIIREHCDLFYGPAGPHVERLYRLTADRYENTAWATQLGASAIPPNVYFEKIYPPDVVAKMKDCFAGAYAAVGAPEHALYKKRLDYIYSDVGDDYWSVDGWAGFFRISDTYHRTQSPPSLVTAEKTPSEQMTLSHGDHIVTARTAPDGMAATVSVVRAGGNLVFEIAAQTPHGKDVYADAFMFLFYDVPAAKKFKGDIDEHQEFMREDSAGSKQKAVQIVVAAGGKANSKDVRVERTVGDGKVVLKVAVPLKTLGYPDDKTGQILFNVKRRITRKDFVIDKRGKKTRQRVFDELSLALDQGFPWQEFNVRKRACRLDLRK